MIYCSNFDPPFRKPLDYDIAGEHESDFLTDFWWLFVVTADIAVAVIADLVVRRRKKPEGA